MQVQLAPMTSSGRTSVMISNGQAICSPSSNGTQIPDAHLDTRIAFIMTVSVPDEVRCSPTPIARGRRYRVEAGS